MTRPVILCASLLPQHGYCGGQTHNGAAAAYALGIDYDVQLVKPHQISCWLHSGPSQGARVLRKVDPEKGGLWHRASSYRYQCARLRRTLDESAGRPIESYAQGPLSARAALAMRRIVLERNPGLANVEQAVIPNFPEHEVSAASQASSRGDVISIGTLEPRKNQGYLLHVLAEAKRLGYRYRLSLVGDGPSRAEWESLAAGLGIADQVDFLGYVSRASSLLPGHRVYAHAARMENLPIALIEALACGLPIFALPVGGIPEVFNDGVEGVAWPPGDPAACAARLTEVLENAPIWERMCAASRQRYRSSFAPDVLGPKWVTAIAADYASEVQTLGLLRSLEVKRT